MMQSGNKKKTVAYIDGANLYRGIERLGWIMDYRRFRIWLQEKYNVRVAYLFIGLIPKYNDLYKHLQECGYTLVFKEVVYDGNGKPKGNCDADLVLQAVSDVYEGKYDTMIIVTSDGDYAGLVKFFIDRGGSPIILSPHPKEKCSILLKRTGARIAYLNDQRTLLEAVQKEKTPDRDRTP